MPISIGESRKTPERHWLHSIVYPEQIKGALLQGGRRGDEVEGHGVFGVGQDAVFGHGGEVTQERVEAVERSVVGGEFGAGLALRLRGTLGWCDHRRPGGLSRGGIVVIEQDGRERLAHVPLDIVGEHAYQDMGAHALFEPMVNRAHFEVD